MAKKHKVYVVWKGRQSGIFKTWEECKAQVEGYPGAEYKSFESLQQAQQAYQETFSNFLEKKRAEQKLVDQEALQRVGQPILDSYAVDAACSNNPGVLEYRCVHTATGKEIFRRGPFENGTSNVGEFLAIVHALALFKRKKIRAPIYSDSEIAIDWVKSRKCRTRLARDQSNEALFQLIKRAEKWLLENEYENPVLKWRTEVWGEIPADFGRK